MIGFVDTFVLARTKLKAKKLRLIVTVLVSGVVFGFIIGGMALVGGVGSSLDGYAREQFDGKYFVNTSIIQNELPVSMMSMGDQNLVKEVQRLQNEYITERKAAAKRLGASYDAASEVPATVVDAFADPSLPKDQQVVVNQASPGYRRYAEQMYAKKLADTPTPGIEVLRDQSKSYNPEMIAESLPASTQQVQYLKGGKESFDDKDPYTAQPGGFMGSQTIDVPQLSYGQLDEAALGSSMLPASTERRQANKTAIPVILPVNAAVKEFGKQNNIGDRPKDTTQLIEWVKSTREKLNGQTYTMCYRNEASKQLVQQAISQRQEIAQNKNTAGYEMPKVLYNLPSEDSCGPVTIVDKQSASEKAAAAKQLQFERETNPNYQDPAQTKLTFVIVGLLPAEQDDDAGFTLEAFVRSFFGTTLGTAAIIPQQTYQKLPVDAQHQSILFASPKTNEEKFNARYAKTYLLQFGEIDSARKFIDEQGCPLELAWMSGCSKEKPFTLSPFGANYIAIDQLMKYLGPVLNFILILAGSCAAIIIMAMMGRVMSDSRRETAVFRAIGARRSDIAKVYMLYAAAVALRIAMFAVLLGGVFALILEVLYSQRATQYAQVAYGVFDGSARFHFIGWSPYIGIVIAVIVAIGLVGVIPPLIRNIRRNPINDMRDE